MRDSKWHVEERNRWIEGERWIERERERGRERETERERERETEIGIERKGDRERENMSVNESFIHLCLSSFAFTFDQKRLPLCVLPSAP